MSIPGVVEFSGTILIPEIGNFKDFSTGDKLLLRLDLCIWTEKP
jgi:hypothetical protein